MTTVYQLLRLISVATLALCQTAAFSLAPTQELGIGRSIIRAAAIDTSLHSEEGVGADAPLVVPRIIKALSTIAIVSSSLHIILHPPAALAADVAMGRELFAGNCAGCHANGANFVKPSKTLQSDALARYVGSTDGEELKKWAMNSGQHRRNVYMKAPGGDGKLTEDEFGDITAFISDQAVGDKW